VINRAQQHLSTKTFPDLGAMMDAFAQAAASEARTAFRRRLDFTPASIEELDEILVQLGESPERDDLDFEVKLWGSYLGEVVRRLYAGNWEMTQYPGQQHVMPAVEIRGSRIFPLMKVHRRLTNGEEEDLESFFAKVRERLGAPAHVN
jgi:hypothetical protein